MRAHLVCPKCHGAFDYDFVPGASVTAIRLAGRHYMACPLCRKWSLFPVRANLVPG
jgi:uncharacterized protein YbaR (Trm112 family)